MSRSRWNRGVLIENGWSPMNVAHLIDRDPIPLPDPKRVYKITWSSDEIPVLETIMEKEVNDEQAR